MNALLAKVGIGAAILIGACLATWFAASAHYSKQYETLKSGYETAARLQGERIARTIADNAVTAKRINDEATQQISNMASTISNLRVRVNSGRGAVTLCPAPASTIGAVQPADGPGATASPVEPAIATTPVAIDPAALDDALSVGIGALRRELLWRDYVRSTGQVR